MRADGEFSGLLVHPLDDRDLLLGPRQQHFQALCIGFARAKQSTPKRLLGVDPREQPLKFQQAAERRVAAESPVGFQAADLLGSPAERNLRAVDGLAESGDDRNQLFPVVPDLGGEILQLGSELAPLVLPCRPACKFTPAVAPAR